MNKKIMALLFVSAFLTGCGSLQRFIGDVGSDIAGGSNRTAVLYSNDGKVIKQWNGKIDLSADSRETYMLIDGKRIIIHGGIMVVEEK